MRSNKFRSLCIHLRKYILTTHSFPAKYFAFPVMIFVLLMMHLFFSVAFAQEAPCFPDCNFKLCSGKVTLPAGKSDVPIAGPVCFVSDGKQLNMIAQTGEASVDGNTKISTYESRGLAQKFAPSFIKAYGNAIGHETPQQNQALFLNNLCITLPVVAYSTKKENDTVTNIQSKDPKDCIALKIAIAATTPTSTATPTVERPTPAPPTIDTFITGVNPTPTLLPPAPILPVESGSAISGSDIFSEERISAEGEGGRS